jgi:hypothetical protein
MDIPRDPPLHRLAGCAGRLSGVGSAGAGKCGGHRRAGPRSALAFSDLLRRSLPGRDARGPRPQKLPTRDYSARKMKRGALWGPIEKQQCQTQMARMGMQPVREISSISGRVMPATPFPNLKCWHPPLSTSLQGFWLLFLVGMSYNCNSNIRKSNQQHVGDSAHRASPHQPRTVDDDLYSTGGMHGCCWNTPWVDWEQGRPCGLSRTVML